jgi:hypothetical protein
MESAVYAQEVSDMSGLEILCTTYPKNILTEKDIRLSGYMIQDLYPVEVFVKTPWE